MKPVKELTAEDMVKALETLKDDTGWQIVRKAIGEQKRIAELKIFGEIERTEEDTDDALKRERRGLARLMDYPDELIEQLSTKEGVVPEMDPYSKEGME